MKKHRSPSKQRQRGSAIVETAFFMPWLVFLFVGILDFGYYSYAAICTQQAARAAAMRTAVAGGGSNLDACTAALAELQGLPNMTGVSTCSTYRSGITNSAPVSACVVTLTTAGSSDTLCSNTAACADCVASPASKSMQAVITYRSLAMIPIPGLLTGTYQLTRTAEVRVIEP